MCGIAGAINYKKINIAKIKENLFHRGPDSNSLFIFENILLAHTRLSVVDLSSGDQPFCIDEYVLIFNGEIYNHKELREKYLQNIKFKTNSDTETLLQLYIKYKEDIFKYLDAMFSFAILNKKTKKIFFAVDKAGKKPLYFYQKNDIFIFASELNTIKDSIKLNIDEGKISSYLRLGYFPFGITPFQNTSMIQASHYAYLDLSTMEISQKKYFSLLDVYKKEKLNLSINQNIDLIEDNLKTSIQNRILSSDINVGAFLSGGIDSSLIVALSAKMGYNLKTFTVRFDNKSFDESPLAKMIATKYNSQHNIIDIQMNLRNDVEKILSNYGEPFMDSSAIPSFYVSREAKKYVSVILSGDGADELFAGYRRYVASKYLPVFSKISFLLKHLPTSNNKHNLLSHIDRLSSLFDKENLDYYLSATTDIFEDIIDIKSSKWTNKVNEFIKTINKTNLSPLSKMLYLDFKFILFNNLLKKMDIASMSQSLEVRSPFLSSSMINIAPRLPDNYKINNLKTKFILRELAKRHLPKQIVNAPKRGFEVPLTSWVENELKDNIMDSLKNGYHLNYIDKKDIDKVLNNKINIPKNKRAKILWSIFALNIWHKNL